MTTLLEEPREVGVGLAQLLLQQFGFNVPDEVLFEWQDKTFNRKR